MRTPSTRRRLTPPEAGPSGGAPPSDAPQAEEGGASPNPRGVEGPSSPHRRDGAMPPARRGVKRCASPGPSEVDPPSTRRRLTPPEAGPSGGPHGCGRSPARGRKGTIHRHAVARPQFPARRMARQFGGTVAELAETTWGSLRRLPSGVLATLRPRATERRAMRQPRSLAEAWAHRWQRGRAPIRPWCGEFALGSR